MVELSISMMIKCDIVFLGKHPKSGESNVEDETFTIKTTNKKTANIIFS